MAMLIVGMLLVGKFMVSLDETSALRFTLTQWHKTFGVLILLLAVLRILWRLTHQSPSHPDNAPAWEHFAANLSHIALYALLFIAPITGWMLVSVSPLNIDTLLFNVIPFPHLPWLSGLADKASAEALYHQFHEISTGLLIALLLLHVAAALKHHLINKDTVLSRMLPTKEAKTGRTMINMAMAIMLGSAAMVFAYSKMNASGVAVQSGNVAVKAVAVVMGQDTDILFTESTVTASLVARNSQKSSLQASVNTASASSSNLQVQGSLPDTDWFDSATYPQATFESTSVENLSQYTYLVSGILTIKGIAHSHQFELQTSEENGQKTANGQFVVDRTAYQLGLESQSNSDTVRNEVTIVFQFALSE